MKKILFATALLASLSATAQIAEVSAPKPLLRGVQSQMYNPVLSADGTKLLFNNLDNTDLRVYSFADDVTVKENVTRNQAVSARFEGNALTFGNPVVRTEGSTLYIKNNGREIAVQPAGECAGYLWESVSPDGTKIAFVAAGKGIYVTDMEGKVLATPGNYEAPVWFGNNHLVAQNATDDGHQYQSSQIVLLTADGSAVQALTRPESMSMTPAACGEKNMVVYSTIDGLLYQLNVTLK